MKKILLTGANGFLGQHLTIALSNAGYKVIATGKGEKRLLMHDVAYEAAELTDEREVDLLLDKHCPDIIIHNAALSKPDECENDHELCTKVNVDSTRYLLKNNNAHFIYISTDFIFGENGPHAEDAIPAPLNFYGQSKYMAEQLVKASGSTAAIVRPVFIYGQSWAGMRPSFLHWVKNNLEQRKNIKVVSDQLRTPTYVGDICKGIEKIISLNATGVYNLAGKDILSPYQMAVIAAEVLRLDPSFITSVTADTFPEPVARAKRSGLTFQKATQDLDYSPVSFEDGVKLTFSL